MGIIIQTPADEQAWEEYYDLRYRVLREPLQQARGSERHEGDADGIHFALYENTQLIAIARLDDTAEETVSQVRFVAVDTQNQGKGYGKRIMEAAEQGAKERGKTTMILHARDYAVDFYTSIGYELVEPSYKLFGVLQHYLMKKVF
jgi:predicted GNAT family N-acyltransferase